MCKRMCCTWRVVVLHKIQLWALYSLPFTWYETAMLGRKSRTGARPTKGIHNFCLPCPSATNKISLILMLIFAMCSADFTDDPVSVTWIAFNGKLMRFRITIFKKQFVCLLFSVCSFITLVENMIAASKSLILTCVSSFLFSVLLHASLLRRCQGILYNLHFPVQQLVNFFLKICVTFYCR